MIMAMIVVVLKFHVIVDHELIASVLLDLNQKQIEKKLLIQQIVLILILIYQQPLIRPIKGMVFLG